MKTNRLAKEQVVAGVFLEHQAQGRLFKPLSHQDSSRTGKPREKGRLAWGGEQTSQKQGRKLKKKMRPKERKS